MSETQEREPNIQQRTRRFAVRILRFAGALPRTVIASVLMKQVVRSGTSIGANVEEAQDAHSRRDFVHSMQISLKEARETLYWIDLVIESSLLPRERCQDIRDECARIVRILTVIVRNAKEQKPSTLNPQPSTIHLVCSISPSLTNRTSS